MAMMDPRPGEFGDARLTVSRRRLLRGGLAAGGLMLLTACGTTPSAPAPAPAPAGGGSSAAPSPAPAAPPAVAPAASPAAAPAASSPAAAAPAAASSPAAVTGANLNANRPPSSGQLVFAQSSEPTTLDPQFEQSGAIGTGLNPMIEHLTEFDRNLVIKTVLADSAQMPTDGVTYRFKLRPGMKFWDGTPVDANAIKFTYERALNPDNRKKGLSDPVPILQGVDHVNVVDPLTVEVVTGKPSTLAWPFFVQEFILNPAYYGTKSFEETAIAPMGSGPWKFVRWDKGDRVEMTANQDYWRGRPAIEKLIFRTIPDAGTRLAALERGEADIIGDVSPDDLPIIQGNAKLRTESVLSTSRVHVGVPCNVAKWQDRRARTALNYAIDVDNIVKFVLLGLPVQRLRTPVVTQGWPNPDIKSYTYDQAKAKDMLNAAGFDFSQPVNIYTTRGGMKRLDVVQAIAADLQKIGMKAEVQVMEQSVFNSKLKAQEFDDLYVSQLGAPSYGPIEVALPTGDLGLDSTHFPDATENGPKYMDLYREVRVTFDETKQHQMVNQLQALFMEESAWILLYQEVYLWGVNKRTDWKPTGYSRVHFWLPDEQDARLNAAS